MYRSGRIQLCLQPFPVVSRLGVVRFTVDGGNDIQHGEPPLESRIVPHRPHLAVIVEANGDFLHHGTSRLRVSVWRQSARDLKSLPNACCVLIMEIRQVMGLSLHMLRVPMYCIIAKLFLSFCNKQQCTTQVIIIISNEAQVLIRKRYCDDNN